MTPRLILASGSPRRRVLLRFLVDSFDVAIPNVDETFPPGDAVAAMESVAGRKARAVTGADAVVVAADTAIILDEQILGKPQDLADARNMLNRLRGEEHTVMTAVAIQGPAGTDAFHASTKVQLNLTDADLEAYLDSEAWQGKAGGYGIQDEMMAPFVTISGSWSNVVGLPLGPVRDALVAHGVECRNAPPEDQLALQNPF